MTRKRMLELLEAARVATLATLDAGGGTKLVPICFVLAGESIYSVVDAKPKRTSLLARLRNVRADPRVSVLAHQYSEDWTSLWWVRAEGRGRVVEAGRDRADAVALLTDKYPQYREDPPAGPVLAITIEALSGWSAVDTP